jgi:glyoxylase-like metal-dependent hydrolase (beta-lactamase superfamily II)
VNGTLRLAGTLVETRVREDVLVFTLGGEEIATSYGANCTAVVGREAVLLVDPFIAPIFARLVEEKLRESTPAPVRHVLLTHHHTDHALGAGRFAARGVEVIAHPACRDRMAAEHPDLIASRRRQAATPEKLSRGSGFTSRATASRKSSLRPSE